MQPACCKRPSLLQQAACFQAAMQQPVWGWEAAGHWTTTTKTREEAKKKRKRASWRGRCSETDESAPTVQRLLSVTLPLCSNTVGLIRMKRGEQRRVFFLFPRTVLLN